MQKVLIIEDDHFSARRLKRLIMDIDDTIDVHGPLKSVVEVTEELAANNDYDLIFSDIRLADSDVFEAFRKVMPQSFVIFTTAYDEYAQKSAVVSPLHDVLNDTRQYRERFLITKGDELCMLCADDICYINMHDNRITAFAVDGTSYPLPMSMNDLEQALDPARFFRLNRQYIANINGIRKISFYFSSKLIVRLKGCKDENIVISKEKATLFKKWLEK